MAAIANGIDFITALGSSPKKASVDVSGMQSSLYMMYAVMFFVTLRTYQDGGFSYILFVGSAMQLLGLVSLCFKLRGTRSAAGLSSQSLLLFGVALASRLTATSLYEGYLPADSSGDWMYQVVDFCALVAVCSLLYGIHKPCGHTYQEEHDTFPLLPILLPCAILAYFFHGKLNGDFFYDFIWAFGLNVETVQLVPQLFLLAKVGGLVDRTTAHFVANTFVACVCRTAFWIWAIQGCKDLSSPTLEISLSMEIGGLHILMCHGIQLIILLDFMYYYTKAIRQGTGVRLPEGELIEE